MKLAKPSILILGMLLAYTANAAEGLRPELEACLAQPEAELDLGHAALLISKEEFPQLDVKAAEKELDALAERLASALAKAGTVRERLAALSTLLFETEHFGLPQHDDAASFLLSEVLRQKRGNCLGLSVLCLSLAERTGLALHGVPVPSSRSGPGHLLVRYDDGAFRVNFDPTERGAAHPDQYYLDLFHLKPEVLKRGYVLANASRSDVLNLLLTNLGGARVEGGHAGEALPLLRRAVAWKSNYAPGQNNLGAALMELSDWNGARQAYRTALALDPDLVAARLGLAEVCLREGNLEAGSAELQRVLDAEPDNHQAKILLANNHLNKGEFGQARRLLEDLVRAQPKDLEIRCNLGKALRLGGELAAAEQAYREALNLDANSADAHHGLGEVLRAQGQTPEGDAEIATAQKLQPDHLPTLMDRALAARQARDWRAAEAAYEAALKARPGYIEALAGWAEVLAAQGRAAEASKRLEELARAQPGNLSLAILRGEMRMQSGDLAGAVALFRAVLDATPKGARGPILQRLAVCYGKLGNHRLALDTAQEILSASPDDGLALRVAAAACEGLRETARAVVFYKKILEVVPEDPKAMEALKRLGVR